MFGNVASWISLLFSMAIAAVVVGLLIWGGCGCLPMCPATKPKRRSRVFRAGSPMLKIVLKRK